MPNLLAKLAASARTLLRDPVSARVDIAPPEVRTDCVGGGCGPAPYWGQGNGNLLTPRQWNLVGPGLSMIDIDTICVNALMWRIVVKILDDAMSPDALPTLSGETLGELTPCIPWLESRGFFEAAKQAQVYARQYGGGAVLCCIDDGSTSNAEEVRVGSVKDVLGFYAIPKWYITPADIGSGRVRAAWYGQRIGRPEFYWVTPTGGEGLSATGTFQDGMQHLFPDQLQQTLQDGGRKFHRSRIIPYMYRDSMDLRQARRFPFWGGWGPGVVECCLGPFLSRQNGMLRLDDIMSSVVMNVLKMPNVLTGLSTPSGGSAVKTALDVIKHCLAYTGDGLPLVAVDGASTLTAEGHNVSGVDKLIGEQRRHLLDTIEYPEVVIYSSGGNNGLSGDSNDGQWRSYYGTVKALQESWCWKGGTQGGGIRQGTLLAQMAQSGPTDGVMDLTVKATWPSLWRDSDKDRAETRLKDAQCRAADALNLGMTPDALIRLDPTVRRSYPAIQIDDGEFPTFADGEIGHPPDPHQAELAKAASTPAGSAKALVEDAGGNPGEVAQDALPKAAWPTDFVTEAELQGALKMSKPTLRKWMSRQPSIVPFPVPAGTRGGHRYSLGQVLQAWQGEAQSRVDALRGDRYPHSHAARQFDPGGGKTRSKAIAPGIQLILEMVDGKAKTQSVRFASDQYTPTEAKKWLRDHGYRTGAFEPAQTGE